MFFFIDYFGFSDLCWILKIAIFFWIYSFGFLDYFWIFFGFSKFLFFGFVVSNFRIARFGCLLAFLNFNFVSGFLLDFQNSKFFLQLVILDFSNLLDFQNFIFF